MDTVKTYQQIIQDVLLPYVDIRYSHGDFHNFPVFDDEHGQYLIISEGWDRHKRVHGCLIHIQIIGDKIWIQRDGTQDGIALELEAAGVPKDHIVLGFRPPEIRPHTGYAAA
jgi:hypothetical protein